MDVVVSSHIVALLSHLIFNPLPILTLHSVVGVVSLLVAVILILMPIVSRSVHLIQHFSDMIVIWLISFHDLLSVLSQYRPSSIHSLRLRVSTVLQKSVPDILPTLLVLLERVLVIRVTILRHLSSSHRVKHFVPMVLLPAMMCLVILQALTIQNVSNFFMKILLILSQYESALKHHNNLHNFNVVSLHHLEHLVLSKLVPSLSPLDDLL